MVTKTRAGQHRPNKLDYGGLRRDTSCVDSVTVPFLGLRGPLAHLPPFFSPPPRHSRMPGCSAMQSTAQILACLCSWPVAPYLALVASWPATHWPWSGPECKPKVRLVPKAHLPSGQGTWESLVKGR